MKKISITLWPTLNFVLFICCTSLASAQQKPNMVFVLADDCSYWDLGAYGSKDAITPNIDKLASEGMKFTKCYQAAPMCSPTRHNLYTGIYPVKTGAYPNHTMANAGTKSIVHYLEPLGYRVALAGKTHISPREVFPFEYLGGVNNGDFSEIEGFINDAKSKDQPFCLFVCSKEPHTPWDKGNPELFPPGQLTLPPFFVDTPDTRENFSNYLAEINYLDGQVGEVVKIIDENKLTENTLVIFSSEQGNSFPFAKWTCYDVGVHSAFIAKWPGEIQPGVVSDALIEYSDVVPTFIEIAGGKKVKDLDGKSLVDLFQGKTKKHKEYAYSLQTTRGINMGSEYYGIRSIVTDQYRYILNLTPEVLFKNLITEKETWFASWKEVAKSDEMAAGLVKNYQYRPAIELYDVEKDPYNLKNLATDPTYEYIIDDMHSRLMDWMEACGDKGQPTEMEAKMHMPKWIKKEKSRDN